MATRTTEDREVGRAEDTIIRYTVSGPADGPTVVLIHGWACDRRDYDELTGRLPDGHRVIAVDLAEHGESHSARDVWTMAEFARDVAAVVEAESVGECTVVGHSLGGAVAVEVGRLLPDTVGRIIALDALHYLFLFGTLERQQAEEMVRTVRDDFVGTVRNMVESGSPTGTDPALKNSYFEKMVTVRQPAGTRAFEGLVAWDMEEALEAVKQPITVLAVRDLATQEALDRLADRIDIVLTELGSHHFHRESPEETARLIAGIMSA
ncbi:alpha/beta fold hydrolase [Streptomyces sp. NPDC057245]|uniref:alpha/beta fold hydrolase n=1 Tax=Streptomyces sp. NPDC057245 TaxID=3346065 RepID=UPI003639D0B1